MFHNRNYDVFDLVYIFMMGGLIGTIYETSLNFILKGIIEDRTGSILLPFNYVYGFGAIVIFAALSNIKNKTCLFISGAVLGGLWEYMICFIQERFLHSRSWDYSDKLLNINGRTTIPYMFIWGVLCLIAIDFIFPYYLSFINRMPYKVKKNIAIIMAVSIVLDAALTIIAITRYFQRNNDFYCNNFIYNFIDCLFDDKFMQKHFPNMVLKTNCGFEL